MHRALYTILALLLFVTLAAAEQNILVSKDLPGENSIPKIAVSSTGDFIVTWTQIRDDIDDDEASVQLWYRYFKQRSNGTYSPTPARMIAGKNEGFNPHVVYIPWKNIYLLTWDSFSYIQPSIQSTRIRGQLLKKNGKPKGKPFTIIDDGAFNLFPRVAVIDTPEGALPKAMRSVLLTYTAIPSKNKSEGNGLILRSLHIKKFKPVGTRVNLVPIRVTDPDAFENAQDPFAFIEGVALTTDILAMRKWYVVSYFTGPTLDSSAPAAIPQLPRQARMAWIGVDNGKKGTLNFDRNTDVVIAKQAGDAALNLRPDPNNPGEFADDFDYVYGDRDAKKLVLNTYEPGFQGSAGNGKINTYKQNGAGHTGTLEGGYPNVVFELFTHGFNADLATPTQSAPAANSPYGYWVYSRNGAVKTQSLTMGNNGKVVISNQEKTRFTHGGSLNNLATKAVRGFGTFIIAWGREIDFDNSEIRVHIYTHDD